MEEESALTEFFKYMLFVVSAAMSHGGLNAHIHRAQAFLLGQELAAVEFCTSAVTFGIKALSHSPGQRDDDANLMALRAAVELDQDNLFCKKYSANILD